MGSKVDRRAHPAGITSLAVLEDVEVFDDGGGLFRFVVPVVSVEQLDFSASPSRERDGTARLGSIDGGDRVALRRVTHQVRRFGLAFRK